MIAVYVAGPYRAATPWEVELNVRRAEALALEVARLKCAPVCPHTMYRFFDKALSDGRWLSVCLELLSRCDAVVLAANWDKSEGSAGEVDEARALGLPVFLSIEALGTWLEEKRGA